MDKKNVVMCPLFPDVPCPQGKDAADQCQVRLENDYDPVRGFKDYLFMDCAIKRAHEKDEKNNKKVSAMRK